MIGCNNPLNIRFSHLNHWKGQDGQTRGFCNFVDLEYGIRAACILLMRSYRKKGCKTYAQLIERFAPRSENDTQVYISFVCKRIGVFPFDVPKTINDYCLLIYQMACFEQGKDPDFNATDVYKVCIIFNIKIYNK